jgi:hypothetical protein
MLHRAAVEAFDGLKLVERHHHRALALGGEAPGEGKDLVRQAGGIALGLHRREGDREPADVPVPGFEAQLGPRRGDCLLQPRPRTLQLRLHRRQRLRVAFQEREVRTVAADGKVDGQGALARERYQRLPHQRRLAVSPRRDQEHLLRRRQVGDQPLELGVAVGESLPRHDFAVDEGIFHGVTLNDVTVTVINVTRTVGRW